MKKKNAYAREKFILKARDLLLQKVTNTVHTFVCIKIPCKKISQLVLSIIYGCVLFVICYFFLFLLLFFLFFATHLCHGTWDMPFIVHLSHVHRILYIIIIFFSSGASWLFFLLWLKAPRAVLGIILGDSSELIYAPLLLFFFYILLFFS